MPESGCRPKVTSCGELGSSFSELTLIPRKVVSWPRELKCEDKRAIDASAPPPFRDGAIIRIFTVKFYSGAELVKDLPEVHFLADL